MTRVAGRLVDQVEKHPAQADPFFARQAARSIQRGQVHDSFGLSCPLLVGDEGSVDRQAFAGVELFFASIYLHAAEATVDPAPLDAGQMVHDPDQAQETILGAPVGLPVGHRRFAHNSAPKEAKPVKKQFLVIVGVIDGKAVLGHLDRVSGREVSSPLEDPPCHSAMVQ